MLAMLPSRATESFSVQRIEEHKTTLFVRTQMPLSDATLNIVGVVAKIKLDGGPENTGYVVA